MRPIVPALALLAGACSAPSAYVTPFIGNVGLDGSFAANDGAVLVSSSFDELGLDDDEAAPGVGAGLSFAGGRLSLSAFDVAYEGRGTATGEIELDGTTITAGTTVDTDLDLRVGRGSFTWNLVPGGPVELGLGLGLSLIDFDLEMMDVGSSARIDSSEVLPIPLLAARIAWTWGPVRMTGEAGALKIDIDGDEGQVLDVDVSGRVDLFDAGELAVGYRLFDLEAEYDDGAERVEAEVELSGFYAGVRFSF